MKRFTFFLVVLFAVASMIGLSGMTTADAASIEVSQESSPNAGDFDANILGYIDPYATALTASGYYQYGAPNVASYNGDLNGGPAPASSLTQIFVVSASDGLSLFVVHDNPNDGSGGSARMRWDLVGDTADYLQGDDPGEGLRGGGTTFKPEHEWFPCCTDGFVIGSLDGAWTMFGRFRGGQNPPIGISGWSVLSGDGSSIPLAFGPVPRRRVRLRIVIKVTLDIKPGSCPNPLNPNSKGRAPVAIVGTSDFDVTMIDPSTVTLAGVSALDGHTTLEDSTTPHISDPDAEDCEDCSEEGPDGFLDLVVKFDAGELADAIAAMGGAEAGGCIELVLTGETLDGIPIVGSDEMLVRKGIGGAAPPSKNSLTTLWGGIKSE